MRIRVRGCKVCIKFNKLSKYIRVYTRVYQSIDFIYGIYMNAFGNKLMSFSSLG